MPSDPELIERYLNDISNLLTEARAQFSLCEWFALGDTAEGIKDLVSEVMYFADTMSLDHMGRLAQELEKLPKEDK